MSFDELVRSFVRGDPDALAEIDREFGPRTRTILRRQFTGLLRRLEIDDVLQLAKLRAWRDRPKFDSSHGSLAAWFFGIARHAGQELANSDWARQRQQETESDFKQTASHQRAAHETHGADEPDDSSLSPTLAGLMQALSTLTDRQRQILLAKANDVATEELAAEFGVSQSTIRNTEAQAMTKLRAELTKLGHPPPHFVGSDAFTYEASNGGESSSAATVNITVTDQAPQATNDGYSLANGQTFTTTAASGVLANDNDADGDTLTASIATQPSHGSLTLNSHGSFSYTPSAGWVGSDSFTYTASDGVESSSPATVTLHTEYSVLSATDETKVPLDTVHLSQQILSDPFDQGVASPLPGGGLGSVTVSAIPADGAPATAHNLSLVYDSVLGQPDQVIEANVGLSNAQPMSDTLTASLTFNGVAQPAVGEKRGQNYLLTRSPWFAILRACLALCDRLTTA